MEMGKVKKHFEMSLMTKLAGLARFSAVLQHVIGVRLALAALGPRAAVSIVVAASRVRGS